MEDKMNARRLVVVAVMSSALWLLVLVGMGCAVTNYAAHLADSPSSLQGSATMPTLAPLPVEFVTAGDFSAAVRQVAQQVRPAVVQITNEQVQMDQFNQTLDVPAGVGSGVIYDSQGHILTNNHVVEGAEKLLVSLPDGRSFEGVLIGRDPDTDLAVMQINGSNLPVAQIGDSKQLQVGDWVVAIGNALALPGGPTVTAGVVSALGRTVQEPSDTTTQGIFLFDVIQTDASINPGNSGGPLVNLAGQVIGINTMVAAQAEPGVPAQGIGFAISMAAAKPIADELEKSGRVTHAALDFNYVPLTPTISMQLGIPQKDGAVVIRVRSGTQAAQAGLKRLDVITEVDGQALQGESALAEIVNAHKPGDVLKLTVLRDSAKITIELTLGESSA
jgi:serine protease Do